MASHPSETLRQSTVAVLSRLGDANLAMLKYNLKSGYEIDLDRDDTFTLEELQIALQKFLGSYGARLLIGEIHNEIRFLTAE